MLNWTHVIQSRSTPSVSERSRLYHAYHKKRKIILIRTNPSKVSQNITSIINLKVNFDVIIEICTPCFRYACTFHRSRTLNIHHINMVFSEIFT